MAIPGRLGLAEPTKPWFLSQCDICGQLTRHGTHGVPERGPDSVLGVRWPAEETSHIFLVGDHVEVDPCHGYYLNWHQ